MGSTIVRATVIAVALFLAGCTFDELAKHCTAYGPFKAGSGGVGFGAAFGCDATAAVAMQRDRK